MEPTPEALESQRLTTQQSLPPRFALLTAAWFGLIGGYLDLGMIFLRRDVFHATLYYEQGKHFRWVVPVANLLVIMAPGLLIAGVNHFRPGRVPLRLAVWLLATLALWGPLLRAPFYGAASLLLAAGLGRWVGRWVESHAVGFRIFARIGVVALVSLVSMTALVSHFRQARIKADAVARLPAPPADSRNVLLLVMDTVRAKSLGLHGYDRDTSPQLTRWAERGVCFNRAQAPAPWTFPSHCSFMTGQWPSTLGAHWRPTLDKAYPTLAEFLASRGFLTAGFAANTHWCSYESEMDRGFVHYEDYPLAPRTILGSTMPGRWILENLLHPSDDYIAKWVRSQSRDARGINQAFLKWLDRERPAERPFFAFLNYLDAHEPFVAPYDERGRFGIQPATAGEKRMLLEYWDRDKLKLTERDVELARDAYDNCIAGLDKQLGALLDDLERRNVLRDTLVIITSDHGEQFGEHGVFNHGFSLYGNETHVPLLIINPQVPQGLRIPAPVSLRDLPATVVDLVGQKSDAPFPGRPLSRHWQSAVDEGEQISSPALSEVDIPQVITPHRGVGPNHRGFTMSLVARGLRYILDVRGVEELYDVATDPGELRNLKGAPGQEHVLASPRILLRNILAGPREAGVAEGLRSRLRGVLDSLIPQPRL